MRHALRRVWRGKAGYSAAAGDREVVPCRSAARAPRFSNAPHASPTFPPRISVGLSGVLIGLSASPCSAPSLSCHGALYCQVEQLDVCIQAYRLWQAQLAWDVLQRCQEAHEAPRCDLFWSGEPSFAVRSALSGPAPGEEGAPLSHKRARGGALA